MGSRTTWSPNQYTDVSDSTFDDFDHDSHMRRAFALAREAADRGDRPFGSVLVRGDTVVMADSNRVVTENDIRRHPELHLAYRACRELDLDERAETVMYTSTEPCPMCATGMTNAGFGRVATASVATKSRRSPATNRRYARRGFSTVSVKSSVPS
nr:nucleoside deaminase [Halorussus sp. MSC15.2]